MKAIVRGSSVKGFSSLLVKGVEPQRLYENQIRVKIKSSRINPIDLHLMNGCPSVKYDKNQIVGVSGAGEVIEVGQKVDQFQKGDLVFFFRKFTDIGAWAEEVVVRFQDVAHIPKGITVEQAGFITLPLLTAYEGLMSLKAKKGEKILIHGAGGGVGIAAVQIAKQMGLKVVAHSSDKNRELLEQLGIDQFLNHKITDFYQELIISPPDYIFDSVGGNTLLKSIKLKPKAIVSVVLADSFKLKNTGVRLNWFQTWLLDRMSRSFRKSANKQKVRLIAQVTAANGKKLQEASDYISTFDFVVKSSEKIELDTIQKYGLNSEDVGKTVVF